MSAEIDEPIDLIHYSLGKNVIVKCKNDRELRGKLHVILIEKYCIKLYYN